MNHVLLVHNEGDDVGVAVADISTDQEITAVFMDSGREMTLTSRGEVPLGHKIALKRMDAGAEVTKYGIRIGHITAPVDIGDYVHTHNLRSARWK